MVLYVYRCQTCCSTVEKMHSMLSRPDVVECPQCMGEARRAIASPHLGRAGSTAMALHDATRATADQPAVVTAPPPAPRRQTITTNPLHRKLPRP
ncbi:FmdB family zinc ribbon protein [Mycolicibacterium sp. XJ879]